MSEMIKTRLDVKERRDIVEKSHNCLWTEAGKPGLEYLIQGRSLSEQVLKTFQIGYIPSYIDHFLRGRIILPVYDSSMNLISISSRRLFKEDDTGLPVYWHEAYEKSWYLYGLPYAKEAMRKSGSVVVCEGQVDVLQLHNHGLSNVVGLCSTKLSDTQLALIYRYCDKIYLLLDHDVFNPGDRPDKILAGQKGTNVIVKNYGRPASVARKSDGRHKINPVFFPDSCLNGKMDPDEFVKKYGIDLLKKTIFGKVDINER